MKDHLVFAALIATFVAAIWLDNNPPAIPDLTPHIDRVMDAIAPTH